MAFYVGQKVQAVIPEERRATSILKHGAIYTVSGHGWLLPCPLSKKVERGVLLAEHPGSRGFTPNALRELDGKSPDISIFKAMLNPSKQEVGA